MLGKRAAQVKARRKSLIESTIAAIHERGSLDITMADIARRAGVSVGLAHHHFGAKDRLLSACMRQLLSDYKGIVLTEIAAKSEPRAKLSALIDANFSRTQFAPEVVSAWLVFYVRAQQMPEEARLLRVYQRRLHSNLVTLLKPLAGAQSDEIAEGVGAMIDGLYLRHSLRSAPPEPEHARLLVEDYIDACLARCQAPTIPALAH